MSRNEPFQVQTNLRLDMFIIIVSFKGYRCSAGIAHNKVLAKLACGLNKPNKQTILPHSAIPEFYKQLPVTKIRGLGGKFGSALTEDLNIKFMAELIRFSKKELHNKFDEKTGNWLYNIARGIDTEPVTTRLISKSIGCCKKFPGRNALTTSEDIMHWLNELAVEIAERLEKDLEENERKARQMVVSFVQQIDDGKDVSSSRTSALNSYDAKRIASDAFEIIKKYCLRINGQFCVKYLGISIGNFENCKNVQEITHFFKTNTSAVEKLEESAKTKNDTEETTSDEKNLSVFSASTEDDSDIKSEDLEFYDDKFEIDSKSNHTDGDKSDADSISEEILNCQKTYSEIKDKTSFFAQYFEKMGSEKESPVKRNFDTSKIFDEYESSSAEDKSDDDPMNAPSTSSAGSVEDVEEECAECGKKISAFDRTAHMDYHFALKIVQSEKEQFKQQTNSQTPSTIANKKAASAKRKFTNIKTSSVLLSFIKPKEEIPEGEKQVCSECQQLIRKDEMASHMDYHVAKRIRLENSLCSTTKSLNTGTTSNTTSKRGAKNKNKSSASIKPVTSFFKPL